MCKSTALLFFAEASKREGRGTTGTGFEENKETYTKMKKIRHMKIEETKHYPYIGPGVPQTPLSG